MRYRHLRRTVIAVLATTAFVLLVGLLVRAALTAEPTRRAAIAWIEGVAGRYGAELEIGELEWRLLPPGVRLRDVRLQSSTLDADIDTLEVDLGRVWLTRRTIELGTVAARGVDVELAGLPPRRGGGRPLQLEVRHLELVDVSFAGSDLPGKIAVAIDDLRAGWTDDGRVARGYADAPSTRVRFGRRETTIEAGLRTRYEVAEGGVTLQSFHIDGGDFELDGSGRLERGKASLEATGSLDLGWLDGIIAARGLLDGEAQLRLALDTTEPTPLTAVVQSSRLEVSGFTFEGVAGSMALSRERSLRGTLERARYRGGSLSGSYSLEGIGTSFEHRAAIEGSGVALAGLLADLRVPPADLGSRLDFAVAADWAGRAIARGSGHADVSMRPDAVGLPVAGDLELELLGDGMLRFDTPELRLGASTVRWQGTLTVDGWEPAWSVAANPARLDEVAGLVNAWVGSEVLPEELAGSADLELTLSGPFSDLIVGARIDAQPLLLPPMAVDHLLADLTIGGGMLRIGTARLQIGSGYGEIDGGLVWADDGGGEQLDLGIRGDRIPVREVAAWIGLADWVDRGRVSLQGRLGGGLAAPRGAWSMGFEDLVIGGVAVGEATTKVELEDGSFHWRGLRSDRGLQGELSWDVAAAEVAGGLSWPGMSLSWIGEPATSLAGMTADVSLQFDLPLAGPATGTLRAVSERARLTVEAGSEVVTAEAAVAGAVAGSAVLERGAGGVLEGGGELRLISAASVLDLLAPDSGVPLEGAGGATFDFEWREGRLPLVSGVVQHLDLKLADQPVSLIRPAAFSISGAGFEVPGLQLRAREDELFLRWAVDNEGGLRGNVSGTMDTVLLRFLLPEWEPAGRASGVVEMLGTVGSPLFEGIAEIHRGSFRLPGTRTILSQVQGTVLLSSGEVQLEGVDFRLMGGRGRCSGRIFERADQVILAIGGTASGVRFEPLPSLRATLSGDWRLTGPVDDLFLAGELELDRMSLESRESAANLLLSWLPQGERGAVGNGLRLDLNVEAEESIELRSPFVRLDASASLDVTGSSSEPGLVGQVEILEGGEATLLGNRYEIERAGIAFSNPQAIEPFFDIQASTWVQEYQITVNLSGTLDNFVTTAVSTPPLSTPEIYSLLGVGYRREDLGSGAVGLGVASSLLTNELTSVLSERAQLVLPVDQVRVDPFAADSTGNPTARLSVIKQLTPYWTVILQTTLSGEREQIVTSRWYLAPGLFVEAAQREDGSLTFDLKLRRPY